MLQYLLSTESVRLLDALMTHVPTGVTIASGPDTTILRVSDHGAALLGSPRSHLEGIPQDAHPAAYRVFHPGTDKQAAPEELPLTRATVRGEVVTGEEWELMDEAGRRHTILCNAGPIRDFEDRLVGGIIAWADITRQKALEAELRDALAQRDMLLAETHHRVKNNLQIVTGIISAEAGGRGPEVQAFASRIVGRVSAIAAAHEAFCRTAEYVTVSGADCLHAVCRVLNSESHPVVVLADASIRFTADQATPLAILVNEVVCNALKHAFPDGRKGRVEVTLTRRADQIELAIADDGIGLPDPDLSSSGIGTRLVKTVAGQLGGACSWSACPGGGTVFRLCFGAGPVEPSAREPELT